MSDDESHPRAPARSGLSSMPDRSVSSSFDSRRSVESEVFSVDTEKRHKKKKKKKSSTEVSDTRRHHRDRDRDRDHTRRSATEDISDTLAALLGSAAASDKPKKDGTTSITAREKSTRKKSKEEKRSTSSEQALLTAMLDSQVEASRPSIPSDRSMPSSEHGHRARRASQVEMTGPSKSLDHSSHSSGRAHRMRGASQVETTCSLNPSERSMSSSEPVARNKRVETNRHPTPSIRRSSSGEHTYHMRRTSSRVESTGQSNPPERSVTSNEHTNRSRPTSHVETTRPLNLSDHSAPSSERAHNRQLTSSDRSSSSSDHPRRSRRADLEEKMGLQESLSQQVRRSFRTRNPSRRSLADTVQSQSHVEYAHSMHPMIQYQESIRALPVATATAPEGGDENSTTLPSVGRTPRNHVTKESLMMSSAVANSATRTSHTSETTPPVSADSQPKPEPTIARLPREASNLDRQESSGLEAETGAPEVDSNNKRHFYTPSPVREPQQEGTPRNVGRRQSLRNYPRFEQPGAVAMEGRAFGQIPIWANPSCAPTSAPEHASATQGPSDYSAEQLGESQGTLATFFSEGFDAVVQATRVTDTLVIGEYIGPKGKCSRRTVICIIGIFFVCFAALVTGLVAGLWVGDSGEESVDPATSLAPTPMPTVALDSYFELFAGVSTIADLTNPGSPQNSACFWLANHDEMNSEAGGSTSNDVSSIKPLVQRYVLLVLYFSTQGAEGWRAAGDWLDPVSHECDWGPSISCNDDGQIKELDLSRHNLDGFIPSEIGFLSNLESLRLNGNKLSGSIPTVISTMSSLHSIRLDRNQLTGTIPSNLDSLISLSNLDLGFNRLNGTISERIFDLTRLRLLDVGFNELTGSIPDAFGSTKYLSFVSLRNNKLSGTIPNSLFEMEDIAYLHLDHNELTGSVPVHFTAMFRKEIITMSHNLLTGTLPFLPPEDDLLSLAINWKPASLRLQEIDISHNMFTGTVCEKIGDMETIRKVDISGNLFVGPAFGFSGSRIEHINFSSNQFTGQLPEAYGSMLKYINYAKNHLQGTLPKALCHLSALEHLDLSENPITGSLPDNEDDLDWNNLRQLNVSGCELSGTVPTMFGSLTQLEFLDLGTNHFQGTIPEDIGNLNAAKYLDLSSNALSGTLPTTLGQLSELQLLRISNNELSGSIPNEYSNLKNIEKLHVEGNMLTGIVPEGVCSLFSGLFGDSSKLRLDCNVECQCCPADADIFPPSCNAAENSS